MANFQYYIDGPTDGRNFDVFGHANGLSVKISDTAGNVAIPGRAMPDLPISAGNTTLHYKVRVVSNNKRLKPGNYQTTIRFKWIITELLLGTIMALQLKVKIKYLITQ